MQLVVFQKCVNVFLLCLQTGNQLDRQGGQTVLAALAIPDLQLKMIKIDILHTQSQ